MKKMLQNKSSWSLTVRDVAYIGMMIATLEAAKLSLSFIPTGYVSFDTLYLSIWQKSALCSLCLCRCGMSDLGNGNMGHHVFIHLALALRIDTIFKKTKISMVLGSFFRHLWSDVWRIVQSGIFGIWWNKDGICMVDCRNPL